MLQVKVPSEILTKYFHSPTQAGFELSENASKYSDYTPTDFPSSYQ